MERKVNEYEERQQERAERYTELSEKAKSESEQAYENSIKMSRVLPFGQPILVGHHSEGSHRNLIKRMDNAMGKSVKLQEKSEYYKNKAEATLNNNTISSDDPEAITKLKAKLEGLELQRTKIKEYNKEAKKQGKEQEASYVLSNLGQNILSIKKRIKHIQATKELNIEDKVINGITIKVNQEANRVQLLFPDIPSADIRTKLKRNGFRWSPTNQAWQRNINSWSIRLAEDIVNQVGTSDCKFDHKCSDDTICPSYNTHFAGGCENCIHKIHKGVE